MIEASSSGVCDRLATVLKAMAAPTSSSTTADVIAARVRMSGMSPSFSVRMTNRPISTA